VHYEPVAKERAMESQTADGLKHSPLDDELWSLAVAAAWIIWRSKERAASIIQDIGEHERHVQLFDVFNDAARREEVTGAAPKAAVLPFKEAQAELWARLTDGKLRAIGLKVGEATWSQIPAEAWPRLDYFYCARSDSIGWLGAARYTDVTVPRVAVLTLWPPAFETNDTAKKPARTASRTVLFVAEELKRQYHDHPPPKTFKELGRVFAVSDTTIKRAFAYNGWSRTRAKLPAENA
jgi:hypothetical protein